jgi:hypothetical protein
VHERLLVEQRDDCLQRRVESSLVLEVAGHGVRLRSSTTVI